MNNNSEIILNKMTDHFGLWEEPQKKKKTARRKKTTAKDQKRKRVVKAVDYENYPPHIQERRKQILDFKRSMKILQNEQFTLISSLKDVEVETRQQELIFAKSVLQEEMAVELFTLN